MKKNSSKKIPSGKSSMGKPPKPYPGFPLTPHNSGKWQKKIRGKCFYFGQWGRKVDGIMDRIPGDGWEEALTIYKAQAEALHAGRAPREASGGFLVKHMCEAFLVSKKRLVDSGELSYRTFVEYHKTTDRMVATFGGNRLVDDLAADDFEKLRADVAKIWGPVRLANEIQPVRTVFKFAYESALMDKPMRFGPLFKRPTKSVMRKHRANGHARLFDAAEIRTLLEAASAQVKAMILLGVNAGRRSSQNCSMQKERSVD